MDHVLPLTALAFPLGGHGPAVALPDGSAEKHQVRLDLLSQRLSMHLSQEVWQRLFHGTGRQGIVFSELPLAVLFVESLLGDGERHGEDSFYAAMERLAREHDGTVDAFAWGGSMMFFADASRAVRTALALQHAVPERKLRMGVHRGDCLLARFRSGGVSQATLLGPESMQAAAIASATGYGCIGLSFPWLQEWFELVAQDAAAAAEWRCERAGGASMRIVPTSCSQPAA